jgi:probable rRNA maturation factor
MKEKAHSISVTISMAKEGLCGLPLSFFERVFQETLKGARVEEQFGKQKHFFLSVSEAGAFAMAKLKKQYLGKEQPTDILSFPVLDGGVVFDQQGNVLLGEVIMCEEMIRRDAIIDGVSYERAMAFIFSHGILHLLGYAHGKEMFALQDKVCDNMKSH